MAFSIECFVSCCLPSFYSLLRQYSGFTKNPALCIIMYIHVVSKSYEFLFCVGLAVSETFFYYSLVI